MKKVAVIYFNNGHHIEKIAKNIIIGLSKAGVDPHLFTIKEAEESLSQITAEMDGIIFGTPTYFGGCSSALRSFFENTGKIFIQRSWCNKISAGFTHSGALSGDKLAVLNEMVIFATQQGMIWVGLDTIANSKIDENNASLTGIKANSKLNRLGSWMGMMSNTSANVELGIEMDESDLNTAIYLGYRVGSVVTSFCQEKVIKN